MLHPIRALLRKARYHKFEKVDTFKREDCEQIMKQQPDGLWDHIAQESPTRPAS